MTQPIEVPPFAYLPNDTEKRVVATTLQETVAKIDSNEPYILNWLQLLLVETRAAYRQTTWANIDSRIASSSRKAHGRNTALITLQARQVAAVLRNIPAPDISGFERRKTDPPNMIQEMRNLLEKNEVLRQYVTGEALPAREGTELTIATR